MKTLIISATLLFSFSVNAIAQQIFPDKAVIEYEVKMNIKKTMGSGNWAERMKENLPAFKTGYYNLTFADNKSIFKFDHWAEEKLKIPDYFKRDDEMHDWYMDFNTGKMTSQKTVEGNSFIIADSMMRPEWRITNETRIIAGFNCRKAVTKIYDSVYVFAFYTNEILLPGGPCEFNGLPGTILGVTIPRLFTSWIATKVSVNGVKVEMIKPSTAKKYYTKASMKKVILDNTKDWWSGDDNEEEKQQKNRFIWSALL